MLTPTLTPLPQPAQLILQLLRLTLKSQHNSLQLRPPGISFLEIRLQHSYSIGVILQFPQQSYLPHCSGRKDEMEGEGVIPWQQSGGVRGGWSGGIALDMAEV